MAVDPTCISTCAPASAQRWSPAQLSLTQGVLDVHIRYLGDREAYEIDTPNVAVSLLRPGDYRIDVDGDNNIITVTVRGGEAEVSGGGVAFPVHAGESARISGVDTVSQETGSAPPPDEFDAWCQMRGRREDQSQSARYVSRETTGYEDLDRYGVWREVPPYGWVWVDPWGWTWIDDAPWGFAPFHYGRWAYTGGGWVWVPGAMAARPVYAPALVAFVGFGGEGMAAWFPLGPGARYANQGVVGAVTVVPRDAFVGARPVARAMVVAPQREIMQAQVVGSTTPPAPPVSRVEGLRAPDRAARPDRPAMAPVRNDRPPRAAPPAQVQERKAEAPKPAEKKAVKKTEKKERPKDIR